MKILLLTPPLTQLNTPYPATAYLTGFLRERVARDPRAAVRAWEVVQADPGLELVLRLLAPAGLRRMRETLAASKKPRAETPAVRSFLHHFEQHVAVAQAAVRFLQGRDPSLAMRIAGREFLPEGPRFRDLDEDSLGLSFGALGVQDRAKHLASLWIDDIADTIRDAVDPRFELSRYGEKLAASQGSFDPLADALDGPPTVVDQIVDEIAAELAQAHGPDVVGFSAPFPGNVYGGLRMARQFKTLKPSVRTVVGGGYVNTELREWMGGGTRSPLDLRFLAHLDAMTFDDGERPLWNLLEHWAGLRPREALLRTVLKDAGGTPQWHSSASEHDVPARETGTPTYVGLPLQSYLSLCELLNPMQRIWSDGRWNKLTLAHGCYWKKCSFCDTSLDYIGRYDPAGAVLTVDRMQQLIAETGQSGFHFVDEAAPPAALKALAEEILKRGLAVSWWGNIRFEKTFTPELCALLARSGCIAVSGGLEVASDRLLARMNKGVTVEQVARVTRAFVENGVLVHAYLMFGFPTQTDAETIDALERVRQLFAEGCLHSAFWHRFSVTAHSPIGRAPAEFGISLTAETPTRFARNDLEFQDPTPAHHDLLAPGLKRALYNYMQGQGLDLDVREWFVEAKASKLKLPRVSVDPRLVAKALG